MTVCMVSKLGIGGKATPNNVIRESVLSHLSSRIIFNRVNLLNSQMSLLILLISLKSHRAYHYLLQVFGKRMIPFVVIIS